ncbi:MAG: phage tail sheath family protein [Ardenticatenaceae bacterium]|nr:phage tail sheath family protein [Ardenticatenaceae bacterium]
MASINYRTPGVYVEEVPSGARPIQAVGTRTAGFIGKAPRKELNPNTAVPVNNWTEFKRKFAGPTAAELDALEKAQTELAAKRLNKANKTEINAAEAAVKTARSAVTKEHASTDLSHAVYGFFLNGGSRCYVVNIQDSTTIDKGLQELAKIDEIAIVAAPGFTSKPAYTAIRDHCDSLKDRVGILDGPKILGDNDIIHLSGQNKVNGAIWDMPDPSATGQITLYTPWLTVTNPDADGTINVPPSGHVAGIWARTDATRGVHKAPANEIVRGAIGLERQITHEEQGGMNANGVNCIRNFTRDGILVWGARTLTNEPAFRYLNVRRLFNMIEESIAEGTRWIVFEPNDRPLWQAIRRDLTAFLMGYWRDGALMGATPEQAFFVRCDEETNPIESINEGRVVIEIGLAPVKPAEFVIFRISQYQAGTDVEVSGG